VDDEVPPGGATRPPTAGAVRRGPELQTERLLLRRWIDTDRAPFAAMNADPLVMAHFEATLPPAASETWLDQMDARFDATGYGLWAVERRSDGRWLGMTGLAAPTFEAAFMPCVEVGWRFAAEHWGHGYATEAARAAIDYGFSVIGLREIVSFTTAGNRRSRAVMERLGMVRDPADDFDYPRLPEGHPQRPHVLYRLAAPR
jgi:RimJ/RimL family protein N-acetyltransferase